MRCADYVFWIIQVTVGLAIFLYWCVHLPARLPGAAGPRPCLTRRSCRSCGVRFRREERAKLLLRRHDLQGDNFNKKATLTMARVQLLISEDRLSR